MKKQVIWVLLCTVTLTMTGCARQSEKDEKTAKEQTVTEAPKNSEETADITLVETNHKQDIFSDVAASDFEADFLLYDAMFNSDPVDLTPMIGEFFSTISEDVMPAQDPNGELYGFEDDFTEGCSVWCAIQDYQATVECTSQLTPQGDSTYDAENIISGSRMDAWVEGVERWGIGESVSISKSYDNGSDNSDYDCFFFPNLCIVNGLAKNEDTWKKNGRVKTLKMYFNEEYICDLNLLDTMKPQYISLSGLHLSAKNNETSTFRFEIADVYQGNQYTDTAITGIEIRVFTKNH